MSESQFPNNPFKPPQSPMQTGFGKQIPSSLTTPAIILIVLAVLNIVYGLSTPFLGAFIGDSVLQFGLNMIPDAEARQQFEQKILEQQNSAMQMIMTWGGLIVTLILSALMLYGALQMKNAASYGWAMAAAIIAIVPCCDFCCCIELPIGIWALVVLLKPEIKQLFPQVA